MFFFPKEKNNTAAPQKNYFTVSEDTSGITIKTPTNSKLHYIRNIKKDDWDYLPIENNKKEEKSSTIAHQGLKNQPIIHNVIFFQQALAARNSNNVPLYTEIIKNPTQISTYDCIKGVFYSLD
jgi:hypothetical protein